jgi:hypothetical protein
LAAKGAETIKVLGHPETGISARLRGAVRVRLTSSRQTEAQDIKGKRNQEPVGPIAEEVLRRLTTNVFSAARQQMMTGRGIPESVICECKKAGIEVTLV